MASDYTRTRKPEAVHPADAVQGVMRRAEEIDPEAGLIDLLEALRTVQDAVQDAMCSLTTAAKYNDTRAFRTEISYVHLAEACDVAPSTVHRWVQQNRKSMNRMLAQGPSHPALPFPEMPGELPRPGAAGTDPLP